MIDLIPLAFAQAAMHLSRFCIGLFRHCLSFAANLLATAGILMPSPIA